MTDSNSVTFKGQALTLSSNLAIKGSLAPDFTLLDNTLSPVSLSDYKGGPVLLITVPSLDTPVCDLEVRKFNEKAVNANKNLNILAISMDLPFAQARWCASAGIERIKTLSDHREASFGKAYGVLIKELRLLARAIFIIDKNGIIDYTQLVKEVTDEPDYNAVLEALKKM
jgi:thiol peroxidase